MSDADPRDFVILWIEDQLRELKEGVAELERRVEEKLGRKVGRAEALTVEQAERELAARCDNPPNLILLDIILPVDQKAHKAEPPRVDMNAGFFLWDRIRRREWGEAIARVPILVVTARGNPEFRPAMEADDNLTWLGKPVPPSKMAEAILGLCQNTARSSGESP